MVTQMMRRIESSLHVCRDMGLGMHLPGETGRTAVILQSYSVKHCISVHWSEYLCKHANPVPPYYKKKMKILILKLWKPRSSVYLSVWSKCQPCLLRWQICHEAERWYIKCIPQEVRNLCCFGPIKRQKSVTSKFSLNNLFMASGNAIGASE